MEDYFELALPDGVTFKGMLSKDRSMLQGPAVVVKESMVMVGRMEAGEFEGHGACADLVENSIYLGTFAKSLKHGYGRY
jgi:hypothetical protein